MASVLLADGDVGGAFWTEEASRALALNRKDVVLKTPGKTRASENGRRKERNRTSVDR